MKPLASDEKTAMVMVYTHNSLVRGEVVIKESLRVSIWLRTQGVPNFIHLHKPQVILFGGTPAQDFGLYGNICAHCGCGRVSYRAAGA